ncbi:LIVCS family branched-chain amino acid:cation transporter [Flavobacteriaceae bacterium MAR_2010_72]|nr:LIVCS family branched-chain amino acid:cation transporter [Flavobacteriaceae bacterium MAR_2010_72]TVZ58418.1 LIVCS family branched-chain amino acid:cation transporter [Flavobacteriaceae bacterium MAR_2010_105]
MKINKQVFIFGFAIFAAFFGAGNLILPPQLGFNAGPDWWLVALGFLTSAVIIPLLALFAHAKLQGTMLDFGNKVSPVLSLLFCLCVYIIAVALPCPRTAAVTYEMAIAPFFEMSSLAASSVYFGLALVFVINRNKVLDILGKYLTPIIVLILIFIIFIGLVYPPSDAINGSVIESPLVGGFLEGYQTYDALAGLLTGGILVISVKNLNLDMSFGEKKQMIAKSGFIAMFGLFIIYMGLIATGAMFNTEFPADISRTALLTGLSTKTLGGLGTTSLSVLVALACFTTAVGIIVGTADFFQGLLKSKMAYLITAIICCVLGVLIGQFNVGHIIDVALPALMFIYPLTIILILLNVIPVKFATKLVFRMVVLTTFIFSIPDFLKFLIPVENLQFLIDTIPFSNNSLGWVLPALIIFVLTNIVEKLMIKR